MSANTSLAQANGALRPAAAVAAMGEYHPPLAGRAGLLLDFNENTVGPSPAVEACLRGLDLRRLRVYPEREPVERECAAAFGLQPEQLLLTNGVDEGIHLLCEAFLDHGDEALVAVPSFGMYVLFAQATGARVVRVQADSAFHFPAKALLRAITEKTKLIFVASPNNPTGAVANQADVLALCAAAPRALVFADEAYIAFGGDSVLQHITEYPNLLVARTFSKAHGLAGLRAGMLCAAPETLHWVRKVASPYNVNALALACLPAAARDLAYVQWYAAQTRLSRGMLENALDALHIPRWPSAANFVLCNIGLRHQQFCAAMRARGVLVRDRSADPGCDGCVRITAGLPEQMQTALSALRGTIASIGWQPAEVTQ